MSGIERPKGGSSPAPSFHGHRNMPDPVPSGEKIANPSHDWIARECREAGECVLTKEQFDRVFPGHFSKSLPVVSGILRKNRLRLSVDHQHELFRFAPACPDEDQVGL